MKWLFLVHHAKGSAARVRFWRLTKRIGALLYRNSVYVLPYSRERLEDFQWLCQQIRDAKGSASVFAAEAKDKAEDLSLQKQFLLSREREYVELDKEVKSFAEQFGHPGNRPPLTGAQLNRVESRLSRLEETYQSIERVDFSHHPMGRSLGANLRRLRAVFSTSRLQAGTSATALKHHASADFRGSVWVTRPHIHIDRLCSAWLIKRFIDTRARFVFAPEAKFPSAAIPFDVFGAEFSHQGDRCTFETLLEVFRVKDRALSDIAELVHDIDLKDGKFHRPESAGLDMIVRSLSEHFRDDARTLELGSRLLDAMYGRLSGKGGKNASRSET